MPRVPSVSLVTAAQMLLCSGRVLEEEKEKKGGMDGEGGMGDGKRECRSRRREGGGGKISSKNEEGWGGGEKKLK